MNIIEMKERKDGGADLQIDMSEEERCFMIEYGFNAMLRKTIDQFNEQFKPKKGTKSATSKD